jgi:hypothetical protein
MLKKVFLGLVLAALVVVTGTAQAQQDAPFVVNGMIPLTQTSVFENPGGLGDTLLYGYYNVRGFNNFIALINTDASNGIIGRIRFREAKASVEVLDFNICLSAGDAWFAIIYDDGTQGFISAFGSDTLTRPDIGAGFEFRHAGNGGNNITAEDTKEGYFEFIGLIRTPAEISTCPAATIGTTLNDVPNALAGGLYLVNPLSGEAYGYTATALANFQIAGITTSGIGAEDITLDAAVNGIEAVNFALTKANVYGAYVVTDDPGILAETAFVVTFPTKRISENVGAFGRSPDELFDRDAGTGCPADLNNVRVSIIIWDDKENQFTPDEQPSPIREQINDFCHEVNVLELQNDVAASNILDSQVQIDVSTSTFTFGYIDVDLASQETNHVTAAPGFNIESLGVPAIGYQLHKFVTGAGSMAVPMWYRTRVQAIPQ